MTQRRSVWASICAFLSFCFRRRKKPAAKVNVRPITRQQHLLLCLGEECAEVAHRVSKMLRFGIYDVQEGQRLDNTHRLCQEIDDLRGVLEMLLQEGVIMGPTPAAIAAKKQKVEKYLAYAKKQGTLE